MTVLGQSTSENSSHTANVFLSYAHEDSDLLHKLRAHLSSLRKARLLIDWCDRLISPGSEWETDIRSAVERADIILLLLSASYFDSKYCDLEARLAVQRHTASEATVIPILLRPVVWQDSIVANLQFLPTDGTPVTRWPDQDEAFRDVASNIRELILSRGFNKEQSSVRCSTVSSRRSLDVAMSPVATLNESTDLVAMVRGVESEGLRAVLRVDKNYAISEHNVLSQEVEIDFQTVRSALGSKGLELALEAPTFEPAYKKKNIQVPLRGDSSPCVFLLTPKRAGRQQLILEISDSGSVIASKVLRVDVVRAASDDDAYALLSVPLVDHQSGGGEFGHHRNRFGIPVTVRIPGWSIGAVPATVQTGSRTRLDIAAALTLTPGQKIDLISEGRRTEAFIGEALAQEPDSNTYMLREASDMTARHEIRVLTNLPVMVHLPQSANAIGGKLVDISGAGFALEMEHAIEPGTTLMMEVDEGFAIGDVRHCREENDRTYIAGLKLERFVRRPQRDTEQQHASTSITNTPGDRVEEAKTRAPTPNDDRSAAKVACLAELTEAEREFAKGTIRDADRLWPLVTRLRKIVEESE